MVHSSYITVSRTSSNKAETCLRPRYHGAVRDEKLHLTDKLVILLLMVSAASRKVLIF